MGDKYSDNVPTIGTKNIGKQKLNEMESSDTKKNSSPDYKKNNSQSKS